MNPHHLLPVVSACLLALAARTARADEGGVREAIEALRKLGASVTIVETRSPPITAVIIEGEWKGGDAGLAHLKAIPNLTDLRLSGCEGVTDEGLRHIAGLASLERLWFSELEIGDEGLQHLAALEKLRTVWLRGSRATMTGMAKLQVARPGLRLEYHGD